MWIQLTIKVSISHVESGFYQNSRRIRFANHFSFCTNEFANNSSSSFSVWLGMILSENSLESHLFVLKPYEVNLGLWSWVYAIQALSKQLVSIKVLIIGIGFCILWAQELKRPFVAVLGFK